MKLKDLTIISLIFLSLIIFAHCTKQKEEHQIAQTSKQESNQDSVVTITTIKPKAINYDSMLVEIADLVKRVKANPENIEFRKQLVAVCYDTTWETILAAGFGQPFKKAGQLSVAQKYAEQAAAADAYRWAAYIKKWYKNPAKPNIGSLTTEIQGGRIVARKKISDEEVCALIEIHQSNIP